MSSLCRLKSEVHQETVLCSTKHTFQKLLTTTCKRELFRHMTFIKLVYKDYNNRLTCS